MLPKYVSLKVKVSLCLNTMFSGPCILNLSTR